MTVSARTPSARTSRIKLSDGNGLYLEVKPNGVKAWRYRFELRQDGVAKESVFAIATSSSTADQVATPKPAPQQAGHQQDQQHRAHAIEGTVAPGARR